MNSKIKIFDAHTHVHFNAFDADRDDVISRALGDRIGMVNVGTNKKTSEDAIALAEKYDGVYATVGLHPIHTSLSFHDKEEGDGDMMELEFDFEYYKKLALHKKVVAIGECGFDYFHLPKSDKESAKKRQLEAFIAQIRLSGEIKKPLMIHCRDAYTDLINILTTNNLQPTTPIQGIAHFFSGNMETAKKLIEMGFYFTFGGVITFSNSYDEIIKIVPMDKILSETDAPYVAPVPHRGKRNEPSYVIHTIRRLAEIKGTSFEEMAEITLENTKRVFNLI